MNNREYYEYYDESTNMLNCENQEEEIYIDKSQYIPRIEGTELILGITILDWNYLPIITCRQDKNIRKYYLFDFIKILEAWEL